MTDEQLDWPGNEPTRRVIPPNATPGPPPQTPYNPIEAPRPPAWGPAAMPPPPHPPGMQPHDPAAPRPVSIGRRLGARLIDVSLILAAELVLGLLLVVVLSTLKPTGTRESTGIMITSIVATMLFALTMTAAVIAYEVTGIAKYGTTLGKHWLGIVVVRAGDGGVPGWGASWKRFGLPQLAGLVSSPMGGILAWVVFASPLWASDPYKAGWYDQWAQTRVIANTRQRPRGNGAR